jgi:IS1 family transposase
MQERPVNALSLEKQTRVIAALTEGCSVRATERLTDVHRETILNLGLRVGEGCRRLLDGMLRQLQVGVIELDEQWSYVGCKQKHVRPHDEHGRERGDAWLFIALDATSKAVLSYVVGKRTSENTLPLAHDLRARLVTRPQITADGYVPYVNAIADAFDRKVDFAQLQKHYGATPGNEAAVRYSPATIRGAEKQVICGSPDATKISTSYVERFNLSTRMHMRRFTRLTNAFSKKLANHRAAIALHLAYYNLCRIHETIRCTPAMALGVTDHPWTVAELVEAALNAPEPTPLLPTQPSLPFKGMTAARAKGEKRGGATTPPGGWKRRLQVIKGGKPS